MDSAPSAGFPWTSKSPAPKTPYPGAFEAPVGRVLPPLSTGFPLHLQKTLSAESSPNTDEGYSTESTPSCAKPPPGFPQTTNAGIDTYETAIANITSNRTVEFFEDLGPLETLIAFDQLPDQLVVYEHGSTVPSYYKRVYARVTEDGDRFYVPTEGICHPLCDAAILHLSPSSADIHTSHSTVKRAAFTFDGKCDKVVAKFPQDTCGAHHRVHHEAFVYEAFPPYISEYFRFIPDNDDEPSAAASEPVVPKGKAPKKGGKFKRILRKVVKVVKDGENDSMMPKSIIIPPVVPKFYGTNWARPILLTEDCGEPVDVDMMSVQDKELCALPMKFLHDVAFVHQGIAPSKFLVQPGPLTVPPERRSWAFPSYRVVGFGVGSGMPNTKDEDLWAEFEVLCDKDDLAVSAALAPSSANCRRNGRGTEINGPLFGMHGTC
ncbi:hypothetical protein C8T65DRAFT_634977 [Cerioporus squamosus]|nr:hypothetical protein C8T65DRAFT_634977 [Cerioporus squamosus]